MRGCQRLAITGLLALFAPAVFAQACDLQSLGMTLHEGTMPDMRGCPRAVVERALRVTEIRADFASGPSDAAVGAVFDQDPKPGGAIKPGMLATLRVSEGRPAATGAGDASVAGTSTGRPAVLDATPADTPPRDSAPADAMQAGTAPTGTAPTDAATTQTASTATTSMNTSPASPDVADSAPAPNFPTDGMTTGEIPADPATSGSATIGSTAVGGTRDGATGAGESTAGAAITGDAMNSDAMNGNAVSGDAVNSDAVNGNAVNGDASSGMATTDAIASGNDAGIVPVLSGGPGAIPIGEGSLPTVARGRTSKIPAWWWVVLALAATLILIGAIKLVRQRRMQRLRTAWDQRVHARALLSPQGDATPISEIPLAAMPFSVAASLGFGEATCIGELPARTHGA